MLLYVMKIYLVFYLYSLFHYTQVHSETFILSSSQFKQKTTLIKIKLKHLETYYYHLLHLGTKLLSILMCNVKS